MASRYVTECDRCGHEINGESYEVDDRDFCPDCKSAFDLFMEPHKAAELLKKRRKKRVARPCPHHVPCAEPWGCSGDEVVSLSDPRPSLDEMGF
jgi:hypothetical protein